MAEEAAKKAENVADEVDRLRQECSQLQASFRELRQQRDHAAAGANPPDRRPGVIFGGWEPNTHRDEILADLQKATSSAGVESLLDGKPWVPGLRKHCALTLFAQRPFETPWHERDNKSSSEPIEVPDDDEEEEEWGNWDNSWWQARPAEHCDKEEPATPSGNSKKPATSPPRRRRASGSSRDASKEVDMSSAMALRNSRGQGGG